jgi:hypothetical protein
MYVNTATVDSGNPKPPEQGIGEDSARFAIQSPYLRVESLPPITTKDGREVLIRRFLGHQTGNLEIVAYVRERTVTPLMVLSARTTSDYDSELPSFYALVRSYEFITGKIKVSDGPPCGMTER